VPRILRPSATTWLAAAVLILLPLLAVLQYRWLSQIGEEAGARMQAVAANAGAALSRDLRFEIGRAWRERAGIGGTVDAEGAGTDPSFVVDALVIDRSRAGSAEPRIRRWDFGTRTCEAIAWPAEYETVRAEIREHLEPSSDRDVVWMMRAISQAGMPFGVVPQPLRDGGRNRPVLEPPCEGLSEGVALIRLDMALLRRTLLPELVRRHLDGLQRDDFRFAIVAGPERKDVVYASAGFDPAMLARAPDMMIPLDFLGEDAGRGGRGGGSRGADDLRTRMRGGTLEPPHGPARDRWWLVAQHRAGSLSAAVAHLRTRNLAVSFGILMLMAVAVGMIVANARKAERLRRQQLEFVAGVSHEMRTPVAAIDLAAGNLADGLIADPGRVQRYGGVIRAEARRLADTVERVLQFAALDAGRGVDAVVDVDLRALVAEVVARARGDNPGATIDFEAEDEAGVVRGDPALLRSCVQNLLGNALKYGGSPSVVGIRLARHGGTKPEAQLTIEDQGPGIDPADLPHIFEPFYRGRLATERRIPGNGLGLHIVKRGIEALGGRISVRTARGAGTSVTIHLPLGAGGSDGS
jgi:signal transduction histidine kinase